MGTSSNASLAGTQHQLPHQLVHHQLANAATKHMTQDSRLKIHRKTGSRKKMKQLGV